MGSHERSQRENRGEVPFLQPQLNSRSDTVELAVRVRTRCAARDGAVDPQVIAIKYLQLRR